MPVFAGFSKELAGKTINFGGKTFDLAFPVVGKVVACQNIEKRWPPYRLLDMSWNAEGAGLSQKTVLTPTAELISSRLSATVVTGGTNPLSIPALLCTVN